MAATTASTVYSYAEGFHNDVIALNVTTAGAYDTCAEWRESAIYAANWRRLRAHVSMLAVVIFFGLIFNTVAFCTFLVSPKLRRTTTARYLIALTVADNTYLIGESPLSNINNLKSVVTRLQTKGLWGRRECTIPHMELLF